MRSIFAVLGSLLIACSAVGDEPQPPAVSRPDSNADRRLYRMLNSPMKEDAAALFEATAHADANMRRRAVAAYAEAAGFRHDRDLHLSGAELRRYRELLHDSNARVRETMARTPLGRVSADLVLLPDLIALLRDDDQAVREQVVYAIGRSEEPLITALPDLERLALQEQPPLAAAAMRILVRWKQWDRVHPLLANGSSVLREAAADEAEPPLLNTLLRDADVGVRESAIHRLRSLGPDHYELIREEILRALHDSSHQILDAAADTISSADNAYEETIHVERLLQAVAQTDPNWLGRNLVWSAFHVGSREGLRDRLVQIVDDGTLDEGLRAGALAVLTQHDNEGAMQKRARSLLEDTEQPVGIRLIAVRAVRESAKEEDAGQIDFPEELLLKGIESSVPLVFREIAAGTLASTHPAVARRVLTEKYRAEMRESATAKLDQPKNGEAHTVKWATILLRATTSASADPDEAWQLIRMASQDKRVEMREAAVEAIESFARVNQEAPFDADILHRLLNDSNQWVRERMVWTLWFDARRDTGSRAAIVAEDLIAKIVDEADFSSRDAIKVLSHCGPAAAPAFPRLMNEFAALETQLAWRDDDIHGRWRFVLGALVTLFPDEPSVIGAVHRTFERDETQAVSFDLVTEMGPRMSMLLPQLVELIADQPMRPNEEVMKTLGHLRGTAWSAIPLLEHWIDDDAHGTTASIAVLRIDPTHQRAGSVVVGGALEESGLSWCFSSPPCLTFLFDMREDGVPWLLAAMRRPNTEKVRHLATDILWHAIYLKQEWLEPAVHVIAENPEINPRHREEAERWLKSRTDRVIKPD